MATDGEALKQRGNEAYKAGKLEKALGLYTQAVAADPTNPVYASNRIACLFEPGRYDECAKDVEAGLRLLGPEATDEKIGALRSKLLRRRALCALYLKDREGLLRLARAALEGATTSADAQKLQELVEWAQARAAVGSEEQSGDDGKPPMPRLRAALWTGLREFYAVGHDDAMSGLAGEIVILPDRRPHHARAAGTGAGALLHGRGAPRLGCQRPAAG